MESINHNNCLGCGLCSLNSNGRVLMKWSDGFLYPSVEYGALNKEHICSMRMPPQFSKPMKTYVAHHKDLERRMDGSSGGVYGAILETIAKEQAYFCGTLYDENLQVHHILSDNPELIKSLSGYKPSQSDPYLLFPRIKNYLEEGKSVLFCGLPCQCHALRVFLKIDYPTLIIVDTICEGMISQDLIDSYRNALAIKEGSPLTNIRYYNKEFSSTDSKRIYFKNGRVIYTNKSEDFDLLLHSGHFKRKECRECRYSSCNNRVGDITIGGYIGNKKDNDKGLSYVSINTEKGDELFEKVKRRVIVLCEGPISDEIENKKVLNSEVFSFNDRNSIIDWVEYLYPRNTRKKIKLFLRNFILLIKTLRKVSRLRPKPLFQFFKYNFFTRGVKTDFNNNGFFFFAPYCELSIAKGTHIILHGPLRLGVKRVPSSKLETRLRMSIGSTLSVSECADIGNGSNIEIYKNAHLEIGELFSNAPIVIICGEHIKIGRPVNIARGSTIRDTNGHLVVMKGYKTSRPVIIGNHVWICSDTTIMPGVKIGDGSIVGANSYVSQKVDSFTLVQGNPAKELGHPEYFVM